MVLFNKWRNILDKKKNEVFYYLSLLSQIGITVVFSILSCIYIYKFIAKFLGENIFLFVFLIILGIIGGFYNAFILIMRKK